MPDFKTLTSAELLELKAADRQGTRRFRQAFHRGGSFDLITLNNPPEVVAVVVDPKTLTAEQEKELATAYAKEAAKLPKPEPIAEPASGTGILPVSNPSLGQDAQATPAAEPAATNS